VSFTVELHCKTVFDLPDSYLDCVATERFEKPQGASIDIDIDIDIFH
jgi:hypothetical protein